MTFVTLSWEPARQRATGVRLLLRSWDAPGTKGSKTALTSCCVSQSPAKGGAPVDEVAQPWASPGPSRPSVSSSDNSSSPTALWGGLEKDPPRGRQGWVRGTAGLPYPPFSPSYRDKQSDQRKKACQSMAGRGKTVGCGILKPEALATETSHVMLLSLHHSDPQCRLLQNADSHSQC